MTAEYDPLAYRIAIADDCDCPSYRRTVLNSDSNTDGAIYYRRPHLAAIASHVNAGVPSDATCGVLRAAIRRTCIDHPDQGTVAVVADGGHVTRLPDRSPRTSRFTHDELAAIARFLGVTPDPPYREAELRRLAGSSVAGPYLAELVDAAYVDVYLSVNVGSPTSRHGSRGYYPYRFEPVHEIPDSAESHPECLHYVVDSAIQQPGYGNQDALDTAARVDADAVVLADVYQDLDATVERVVDGLSLYHQHRFDGDVIVPLQPPHDECYRRLRERGVPTSHTYALGGLKDCDDDHRKLQAAHAVRSEADPELRLHGLGFGVTDRLAAGIRDHPELLDSVDYSTPGQSNITATTPGEKRLCTVAARAGAALIEDLRRVSPLVDADGGTRGTTLTDYTESGGGNA